MRQILFSNPFSKVRGQWRAHLAARWARYTSAVLAALALAGCAGTASPFLPAATNAKPIYDLFLIVFTILAIVFVGVVSILIYTAYRFSRHSNDPALPPQIEGSRRLEVTWTLAVLAGLVILFLVSLQTLNTIAHPQPAMANQADTSLRVRVIGHRWWWEFVYPALNIITANELHVPIDVDLQLEVESVDVVHSFWVPQLAGKQDAVPGHINPLYLRVTQSGVYLGACAEYCGLEHANMRLRVIAETPEQFQAWVQAQQAPAATVTGLAAEGQQEFFKGTCIGCHTINGTTAKGVAGPNLTHFASRQVFAGAVATNAPEYLAEWLANPSSVKPGVTMPKLPLTPDQINALTAFLETLK